MIIKNGMYTSINNMANYVIPSRSTKISNNGYTKSDVNMISSFKITLFLIMCWITCMSKMTELVFGSWNGSGAPPVN